MTKLSRRRFMYFAAAAAGLPTIASAAWAQTYPMRPVRVIVPFPPGGVTDTIARPIGQWLSDRLHKPFVIENRPGLAVNGGKSMHTKHAISLASLAAAFGMSAYRSQRALKFLNAWRQP